MMQDMMQKYDEVRDKVEKTRHTLAVTAIRMERQHELTKSVTLLKERAEKVMETRKELEKIKAGSAVAAMALDTSNKLVNNGVAKGRIEEYAQTVARLQDKLVTKKSKQQEENVEEVKSFFV